MSAEEERLFYRVVSKRFPAARVIGRTCVALDVGDCLIVNGCSGDGRVQFLRASDGLALQADERVFDECTSPVEEP